MTISVNAKLISYYARPVNARTMSLYHVHVKCRWEIEVTTLIPVSDGLSMISIKYYMFQRILF